MGRKGGGDLVGEIPGSSVTYTRRIPKFLRPYINADEGLAAKRPAKERAQEVESEQKDVDMASELEEMRKAGFRVEAEAAEGGEGGAELEIELGKRLKDVREERKRRSLTSKAVNEVVERIEKIQSEWERGKGGKIRGKRLSARKVGEKRVRLSFHRDSDESEDE